MDKQFHHERYWVCDYLSLLGLKSVQVIKRGPWTHVILYDSVKSSSCDICIYIFTRQPTIETCQQYCIFTQGNHRSPVDSPHKWAVKRWFKTPWRSCNVLVISMGDLSSNDTSHHKFFWDIQVANFMCALIFITYNVAARSAREKRVLIFFLNYQRFCL